MHMTATRRPACRCRTCWPAGQSTPATTGRACWASLATPFAMGWPSMPPEGWPPCWRPTSPRGTPVPRAPEVLARLEQALRRREGFASDEARRQWVRRTHGVIAVLSSGRDEHSLCFSSEVAPALVLRHCRQQLLGVRV